MKKTLLCIIFSPLFLLNSCAETVKNYMINYNMSLEVDKPDNIRELSVLKQKVNLLDDKKDFSFSDNNIEIKFKPYKKGFKFNLKNKTDNTIKVIWEQAAFSDEYNITQSLFNYENIYNEKKEPSVILRNSVLEDIIISSYYIDYKGKSKYIADENYFPTLINDSNYSESVSKNLNHLRERFKNKIIRIMLPIEINQQINQYIFSFKINDINLEIENDE